MDISPHAPFPISLKPYHLSGSPPNDELSLEILKTDPMGYLNCLPGNRHVVFGSFFPDSSLGAGKSSGSIKPGPLLIRFLFGLIWIVVSERSLSGYRDFSKVFSRHWFVCTLMGCEHCILNHMDYFRNTILKVWFTQKHAPFEQSTITSSTSACCWTSNKSSWLLGATKPGKG